MQNTSLNQLVESWQESPFPTTKITSYFPVYVELFEHLRGTECTFIETGILDGGSLYMWRDWLGAQARIIGIDLNPSAVRWRDHGFEIFVGDQGDPLFWKRTLAEIGHFDALLDDGGHQSFQQIVTAYEAIGAATSKCVVAVEDTATSFMIDFEAHGKRSFLEYSKDATDLLTARSFEMYPGRFIHSNPNERGIAHLNSVFSIQFFNGIVAFKVDPEKCVASKVVRNLASSGTNPDFRYSGANSATVEWPGIASSETVVVYGGGR